MVRAFLLADSSGIDATPAIVPTITVVGVAIGLFVVVKWVRRRVKEVESGPPAGFTLGDLRKLVKQGKMTAEEFERAKENVLAAHKKAQEIKPAQETLSQKQRPA